MGKQGLGPHRGIFAPPLYLRGAEELVPIGPDKAPVGPEKAPISPILPKGFLPDLLGKFGV